MDTADKSGPVTRGEPLALCRRNIQNLSHALSLHVYASVGYGQGLEEFLRWDDDEHIFFETGEKPPPVDPGGPTDYRFTVISRNTNRRLFDQFTPPDLHGPAQAMVQILVNRALRDSTRAQLLRDTRSGEIRLHATPTNLLAAIWLQFARHASENTRYTQCGHCRQWIDVTPPKHRSSREYCGDRCRQAANRAKPTKTASVAQEPSSGISGP